jgi:hypothetical protein
MKPAAALCIAASLVLGGPAFAAERGGSAAPNASSPTCMTLDKLKAGIKGAKFTPLTIGQFNFMLGVYDAVPPRGPLPSADNALLVRKTGKSAIFWMKGACASVTPPTQISDALATDLWMIHPTTGETSDAIDDSQDLHL